MEGTDQHVLTHHSTKTLHLLGMEETFNPQSTSFYKELKKVGGGEFLPPPPLKQVQHLGIRSTNNSEALLCVAFCVSCSDRNKQSGHSSHLPGLQGEHSWFGELGELCVSASLRCFFPTSHLEPTQILHSPDHSPKPAKFPRQDILII